jgi:endonuclease/exonuclease/phosphatase family metal-dependent hydrolase
VALAASRSSSHTRNDFDCPYASSIVTQSTGTLASRAQASMVRAISTFVANMCADLSRRPDAFWTTRPQALRGYRVIDSPAALRLSDHLPIRIDLDPTALDSGSAGGAP